MILYAVFDPQSWIYITSMQFKIWIIIRSNENMPNMLLNLFDAALRCCISGFCCSAFPVFHGRAIDYKLRPTPFISQLSYHSTERIYAWAIAYVMGNIDIQMLLKTFPYNIFCNTIVSSFFTHITAANKICLIKSILRNTVHHVIRNYGK